MLTKRYPSATRITSVIDTERLRSGPTSSFERDPAQFLPQTYPTEDLHRMLRCLSGRFSGSATPSNEYPGLILAEGVKGQGKSHALVLGYHLFANPAPAAAWMGSHGYSWSPPANTLVIVEKFTDQYLPFDSLWTYIGQKIGAAWSQDHSPSLAEFRSAFGDRHIVLIFDELERGITNISDPTRQSQNLSFLQMLSEEANRDRCVTMIAAIYNGTVEPGLTLKRVQRLELRFRKAEDRAAIVRHRLFSNADSYDRKAAEDLIQSYVNTWRRMGVEVSDEYLTRLTSSFPFLPELIDLIFERIGGGEAFQGTRGALGLLGAMVDASAKDFGLLTAAHCKLTNDACADRLQDLDPAGTTIACAAGNLRELANQPYAEAIASATLLASLVPRGARGLSREELIRHVAEPGCDPNRFEAMLEAFRRYGSYFHREENRFYFDIEENEEAKVELEALRSGNDEAARQQIADLWLKEMFKDSQQAVVLVDFEATRGALSAMSKKREPRFVLAPRRLSNPERHGLYRGTEYRNQILLLEPRDDQGNHLNNPDLLFAAKRNAAALSLAPTAKTADRRDRYERIAGRERKVILDALKQAGLVYVRVERWAEDAGGTVFEVESLGSSVSREDVLNVLRRDIFPPAYFAEHLRERLSTVIGQSVEQVDRLYRTTLGYPVPLKDPMIADAIRLLVEDRETRPLGLTGPRGHSYCGQSVDLSPSDLDQAILRSPWPEAASPPVTPTVQPVLFSQPSSAPANVPAPTPPITPPGFESEEVGTPSCKSPSELRQQIAARLGDISDAEVQRTSFRILASGPDVELSGYSSGIRGSLNGKAGIDVQIELTFAGPLSKAEVEAKCEQLPQIQSGSYSARIWVLRKRGNEI